MAQNAVTTSTEQSSGGIAAGVKALGLDGRLLGAQIVNFLILLVILRYFLYRPIVALLNKRRETIESSLRKAEEIEERYKKFEIEHAEQLTEAKTEVAEMLAQAKAAAEEIRQSTILKTQDEVERLLRKAELDIDQRKTQMLADLKHEIGSLVVAVSRKVIGSEVNESAEQKLIEQALKEVRS